MKIINNNSGNDKVMLSAEPFTQKVLSHHTNPLLRLENISKQFLGTLALDKVSFDVHPGEVHALFGQNGAGKSTLIQIIAGDIQPTSGSIFINEELLNIHSVHHARELGISVVFQEFSLIPHLTVEENLFLGSEMSHVSFINKKLLRQRASETLDKLGFNLKPEQKIIHLSRAEQRMIEIAKAFHRRPSIMILDEPTAPLTENETSQLFSMIDVLKQEGIGVIYITHRTSEIYRICDRVTILQDGKVIQTNNVTELSEKALVALTVGYQIDEIFPKIKVQSGRLLLDIKGLTLANDMAQNISLSVHSGEVVGIAGLAGCGKSQVAKACFGLSKIRTGQITYLDNEVYSSVKHINDLSPRRMLDRGMFYLPPDRRKEGLVMGQNMRANISLPSLGLPKFSMGGLLRRKTEKHIVKEISQRLNLNPQDIEQIMEQLSGGTQQKVMLAKCFAQDVKLLILDEPTVGVDIGTRIAIYQLIRDFCEAGGGVLLISSDLSEIVNLTHRTYVMHDKYLSVALNEQNLTEETVESYFYEDKTEII